MFENSFEEILAKSDWLEVLKNLTWQEVSDEAGILEVNLEPDIQKQIFDALLVGDEL